MGLRSILGGLSKAFRASDPREVWRMARVGGRRGIGKAAGIFSNSPIARGAKRLWAGREGTGAMVGGLVGSMAGAPWLGAGIGASAAAATRAVPKIMMSGIPEVMAKAGYLATFAPLAVLGAPVLKVGEGLAKGAFYGGRALGRTSINAWAKGLSTPRGRRTAMVGLGMAGLGLGLYGGSGMMAPQIARRRDPGNTMGLSQSLHNGYRR
jgi:hypothetical protein